jgi:hypothetical protein
MQPFVAICADDTDMPICCAIQNNNFLVSQIACTFCALTSCLEWNLLFQTDSGTAYPTCSEVLTSQFCFLAEEL